MHEPKYNLGQLFFEKQNGRVWKVVKLQEDGERDGEYYRCWYFLQLVKGKSVRKEATVIEDTFERSMIAIDNLEAIPTAEMLYGKV